MNTYTQQPNREPKTDSVEFGDIRSGSSRFALFRYELNGILVYDSHSRRSDEFLHEVGKMIPREPLPEFKNKKVDKAYEYGNC